MGMRKYLDGTKFLHLSVARADFAKNTQRFEFGVEHLLQFVLSMQDDDDPNFYEYQDTFTFEVPSIKFKTVPVFDKAPKTLPNGENELDKDGNVTFVTVQNGEEEVMDPDYVDPFSVDVMKPEGANAYKLAYDWLKKEKPFFADFEDDPDES